MHCPYCGHTAPHHTEHDGCTGCSCTTSWLDIAVIHVGLYSNP
jgi:hypothetical protein